MSKEEKNKRISELADWFAASVKGSDGKYHPRNPTGFDISATGFHNYLNKKHPELLN